MTQVAIVLFWVLLALVLAQGILALGFVLRLLRFRRPLLANDACPRAAVVLCLRGSDPFLVRCLDALLQQDYPHYEVRIVIDSRNDPARAIVDQVLAERPASNVVVEELSERLDTCSLKCSSLVQAVTACDDEVAIVAQLDADTIPHPTWLRELATALSDDRVGAATGNRWYMPHQATFGSLVRYAWNAAAVVQMYWYGIAWGGTLAIRTQVIREAKLLDRWSRAFCEDTMLFHFLREAGWKVAFVPSLIMINRETCDLPGFRSWVQRQLLTARLYHPRWGAVVLHGLGTSVALVAAAALLLVGIALGNWVTVGWLVASLGIYQLAMFVLLFPIEWQIRNIKRARGDDRGWLSVSALGKLLVAVPITQFTYPSVLAGAMRLRWVDWRGVSYEVGGPWSIRLVEYHPYEATTSDEVSTASL